MTKAKQTPGPTQTTSRVRLPVLIELNGGWFMMGSENGRPDERPVHSVQLQPFAIGLLPITNAEYAAYVEAGGAVPRFWHDPAFNSPRQPVVAVPWDGAVAYCAWLSDMTGRRFRLPTEAEWEYAARGGVEGRRYPWGDEMPEVAPGVALASAPFDRTAIAGSGPANPFGLLDMGWNVHEWCSDWYSANFYVDSPAHDPSGPSDGTRRASRGGAWRHQIKVSRTAARSSIPPQLEYNDYGFRVAADLE